MGCIVLAEGVSVLLDVDDCAAGQIAASCSDHGTCSGHQPEGSWTCACDAGYQLLPNHTLCKCQCRSVNLLMLCSMCLVRCYH